MKPHGRKMVAPIVITALVVLYYAGYFAIFLATVETAAIVKVLLGVVPLLLASGSIYVLRERIKEIRSGEEDDLGKY